MMRLAAVAGVRVKRKSLRKRVLYHSDNSAATFPRGHMKRGYTQ